MDTLHALNPDCKVIITLRDPVDRAYSYWKWEVFVGGKRLEQSSKGQHFRSFSDYIARALSLFPSIPMESVAGMPVLESGIYHKAVELWIERFGRDNVLVMDVADYFRERQPVLDKVQNFLELPVMEIPEYTKKANENPMKLPPPDPHTLAALAKFYQPYNQKLFELLGTKFSWQLP
nr:sulfotransferase domain-containing protein [Marinibactrum halimedae]